jgi:hypothetical protein
MQERVEQITFLPYIDASVREYYVRRAAQLTPKATEEKNFIGEPVIRYTETHKPMYPSDSPDEMYRYKREPLLEETPFGEQKIIGKTIYISNGINGKDFRAGFLDNEIVAKRLLDSKNGKWPQKRNMRPYILLTPAKYHFTRRDQMIDQGFKPGETIWIPSGCELKIKGDRKKEKIGQIKLGY